MGTPVTWKQLRDKLLVGANDPGGTKLSVYEAHFVVQLTDNLEHTFAHPFKQTVEKLETLESERVEDDADLARRDARSEKD